MAANKQRASPAQGRLPLTREERLAAIDAFEPAARESMGPRAWRTVRGLLKAIEFCSSAGNDSVVRVEVLAAHLGVDVRTVQRARQAAEAAGLLAVVVRQGSSNQWRVDWCRLTTGSSAPPPPELSPPENKCHPSEWVATSSHPGGDMTPGEGRRHVTPPYRGSRDSKGPLGARSTVDAEKVDQRKLGITNVGGAGARSYEPPRPIADVQRVRQIAERIERRIGKCRSQRDWELAVKVAALGPVLGEDWLWDACEAVERVRLEMQKRNEQMETPWGYANRCWQSKAAAAGRNLKALLAQLAIPPALARYDGAAWRKTAETARMCQGGEL